MDKPLGQLEAMSYYIIAAAAGHDTTSNTAAGALWGLAENPDRFRKVKADLSMIPAMAEASVRWETPAKHFMRTATADTQVAGKAIKKGDWLFLSYPPGNRDEAVFEDASTFMADRTPNKHVAFGYGAHVCLGQRLARMEMRVLWEELLARLKSAELSRAARRTQANFGPGPQEVPIRFEMG
ncbi:MAG: cytochrome P450 [Hyphomonas sp.]|uniref:cytochrome P450 n=1 Tax=Hyphomonas sp. TaxID=87 RepID=UPI0034A066E7